MRAANLLPGQELCQRLPSVHVPLELVQELKTARRALYIACVRAHDGHVWNTRADRLAARGLQGVTSSTMSSRWAGRDESDGSVYLGNLEDCFMCLECFEDTDERRAGIDPSLPTPSLRSRAGECMWDCEHEPCRACVPALQLGASGDRCPLCRQPT